MLCAYVSVCWFLGLNWRVHGGSRQKEHLRLSKHLQELVVGEQEVRFRFLSRLSASLCSCLCVFFVLLCLFSRSLSPLHVNVLCDRETRRHRRCACAAIEAASRKLTSDV